MLTVTTPWAAYFSRELAAVVPDIPQGDYDNKRQNIAAGILQNVVSDAHALDVQAKPLHRCHRDPYRAIIDTADMRAAI